MQHMKMTHATKKTDTPCILPRLFPSGTFILVVTAGVSVVVPDLFSIPSEVDINAVALEVSFGGFVIVSYVALLMVSSVVITVSAEVALKLLLMFSETNAVEKESTWLVLTSFDSLIPTVAADWVTNFSSVCSALVAIVLDMSSSV